MATWQGDWQGPPTAASAPTAPTVSISVAATTATLTIAGDAGVTHQVYYQAIGAAAWSDGGDRVGDGDKAVAGLTEGTRYVFIVQSLLSSVPSVVSAPVYGAPAVTGEQTPTGAVGIAVGKLREMFAESATFQSDIGAVGDAAAKKAFALQYVHSAEYKPSSFTYPAIVICRYGNDSQRISGRMATIPNGMLKVIVNRQIPAGLRASSQNADIELDNFLSTVITEVLEKSMSAGYLLLRSIDVDDGPYRFEDAVKGEVAGADLRVEYGLTG